MEDAVAVVPAELRGVVHRLVLKEHKVLHTAREVSGQRSTAAQAGERLRTHAAGPEPPDAVSRMLRSGEETRTGARLGLGMTKSIRHTLAQVQVQEGSRGALASQVLVVQGLLLDSYEH